MPGPTIVDLASDTLREILAYLDLGSIKSLHATSNFFKDLTKNSYLSLKKLYGQLKRHKIISAEIYANNIYFLRADGRVLISGDTNCFHRYVNNLDTTHKVLGIKLIPNLSDVTDIAGGYDQIFFVKRDGTLWTMGCNFNKRLGLPPVIQNTYDVPTLIPGIKHVKKVYVGGSVDNNVILHEDNTISVFGSNDRFQIPTVNNINPNGHIEHYITPPYKIKDVSVGSKHIILLDEANQVHVYGNFYDNLPRPHPTAEWPIPGLNDIQKISSSRDHFLFVQTDGKALGFGSRSSGNSFGELGLGHSNITSSLVSIPNLNNIKQLISQQNYSIAVTHNGDILVTGRNSCGVLGLGDLNNRNMFTQISNLHEIEEVKTHHIGVIARDKNGKMYGWGANQADEFGLGHTNDILSPQPITIVNRYYELMEKLESICSPKILDENINEYCGSLNL